MELTKKYDGKNISYLMSEQTLASSCFYINYSASQANDYARSDNYLRDYLTNKFYQDAFSSTDISRIVGRNLTESDLYPETASGSTKVMLSDQKVFTPTYNDMLSYSFKDTTASDDARLKSPTDFAIANYTSLYTSTSYATIDRVDGGTGITRLCSSGSSASLAFYVDDGGFVGDFIVYGTDAGVCPALLFNL